MFKKLKQKIEEGVATAQGKSPSPQGAQSQPHAVDGHGRPHSGSGRRQLPADNSHNHDPSTGTLINLQDDSSSAGEFVSAGYNTPSLNSTSMSNTSVMSHGGSNYSGIAELPLSAMDDSMNRSRTSSISSQTSEASLFAPIPFGKSYALPSDIESASEVEDSGIALNTISKEELYQYTKKMERRSERYKYKFTQVMTVCQDLERERDKLRKTLTQAQDKTFRRISELKEQIQLDQLAKQHIEDNYRLMLEEKDELITVLHTQVSLLKQGQEVPADLEERHSDLQMRLDRRQDTSTPNATPSKDGDDSNAILRDKVKRLELLLTKCKESIRSSKERNLALMTEKEHLLQKVEDKDDENRKLRETYRDKMTQIQTQMKEAKKVIEELETGKSSAEATAKHQLEEMEVEKAMAIAEVKQQMHITMETKDSEIEAMNDNMKTLKTDNDAMKDMITTLEKEGKETLNKSREIIRHLKDEKKSLETQMKSKIETSEQSLEEERDSMLQELRRGKVEALQVMSSQMEQKVTELIADKTSALEASDQKWQLELLAKDEERINALRERDAEWKAKLTAKEKEHEELLSQQMADLKRTLHEREEEMKLAIEERDLQKMAALSQKDTEEDELKEEVESLRMRCNELDQTIASLCTNHKGQMSDLVKNIEENSHKHRATIDELRSQHLKRSEEYKEASKQHFANKIAELHAEYKLQIDSVQEQQDKVLQNSSGEMEKAYRRRLSEINAAHDKVVQEQISQIERFRKQVHDLESSNSDLDKALAAKTEEFKRRSAELEEIIASERETNGKLEKEKANLLEEFTAKQEQFVAEIAKQAQQVELLKQNLKRIAEENAKSHEELERKSKEHDKLLEDIKSVRTKRLDDLETHKVELAQKVEHYEEALRLEREGHKSEMSRKLEEIQLQQGSADQVSSEMANKLGEANRAISELERRNQELVLSEKELMTQVGNMTADHDKAVMSLTSELASVKSDYEGRLARAGEKISSLEGQINDLIEKENQLNSDLDQAKNDYERRISAQDAAIQSLQECVTNLQSAEENLQKQLTKTQQDCDENLAACNETNNVELTRLSDTLRANESEFQKMLQLLEMSQKEVQDLSARIQTSDSESNRQLEEATSKIQDYEIKIKQLEDDLELRIKAADEQGSTVKELQQRIEAQDSEITARNQTLAEGEQMLINYKEQIKTLEMSLQKANRESEEKEKIKNQQVELLQSKVNVLESSVNDQENSSGDLLGRISNLEESLMSKDKTIAGFESKIKEFGENLERQTDESRDKTDKVEAALRQKDSRITELQVQIKDMTAQKSEMEAQNQENMNKLQEQQTKFEQLRAEAKLKIKDLKGKIQEFETGIEDKDVTIAELRIGHEDAMKELLTTLELERREKDLDYQAEIKVLSDRLERERENMKTFKDSVKTQFDERQVHIKETIEHLKAGFSLTLQERDLIHNKKMERLERQKNQEKDSALSKQRVEMMESKTASEKRVEEVQNKYEEEVRFLKAEVESGKVRLQELTQQYQSEKEALLKHAEVDKDDVLAENVSLREEKSSLEQKISDLMNQSTELHDRVEGDQGRSAQLQEQLKVAKSQEADLSSELNKLTEEQETGKAKFRELLEKQETELQEKSTRHQEMESKLESLTQEKDDLQGKVNELGAARTELEASVGAHEEAKTELTKELESKTAAIDTLERMKQEQDVVMNRKEEDRLQTSTQAEEQSKSLQEREQQVKDLESRLVQLKEKAQAKIKELRRELTEKDEALEKLRDYAKDEINRSMTEISDTHAKEVNEYKQKVEDLDKSHVVELQQYEKRMKEMSSNDEELQTRLKELTEKLNRTEEELTESISQFHSTVQSYQQQLETQKTAHANEIKMLQGKVGEMESHYKEQLVNLDKDLRDKLNTAIRDLKLKETEAEDLSLRLKSTEEEASKIKSEMEEVEKKWQEKLQEMKQKYLSKLKVLQEGNESKMKEVLDNSAQGSEEQERAHMELLETRTREVMSELDELRIKYKETQQTSDASQSMVLELQAQNEQFVQTVSALNADLEDTRQCLRDLEKSVSEKDNRIKELCGTVDELQESLVKLKEQHESELIKQGKIAEDETNEKLGELKKKAEMRLGQIKRQIQGNKEGALTELNDMVASLEGRIVELEQEVTVKGEMVLRLQDTETSLSENNVKLTKQAEELRKEKADVEKQFEEQLEKVKTEHAAELTSREVAVQQSLQQADGHKDSENQLTAQLKQEEELNKKLSALTLENKDLKKQVSKLCEDLGNLRAEKETDCKLMTLEHQKEFSTLRAEYDERIEEMEEDHKSRVKQLVKEFNLKMAEKEQEFQDTFSDAIDKSHVDEDKLFYEHRKETEELHRDLYDKDSKMEEVIENYEVQVEADKVNHKAEIQALEDQITQLQTDMINAAKQYEVEKKQLLAQISQMLPAVISPGCEDKELVFQNQLASAALQSGSSSGELLRQQVIELSKQIDEIKMKHSREVLELQGQLADEYRGGAAGSGDNMPEHPQLHALEVHNMDLQAKILQQSGDLAQLKIKERELKHQLQMPRSQHPPSDHSNHSNSYHDNSYHGGGSLSEITEIEYLRNILFEYMQGKETKTLARVICTVVKFSEDQIQQIMEKEDSRTSGFFPKWLSGSVISDDQSPCTHRYHDDGSCQRNGNNGNQCDSIATTKHGQIARTIRPGRSSPPMRQPQQSPSNSQKRVQPPPAFV